MSEVCAQTELQHLRATSFRVKAEQGTRLHIPNRSGHTLPDVSTHSQVCSEMKQGTHVETVHSQTEIITILEYSLSQVYPGKIFYLLYFFCSER